VHANCHPKDAKHVPSALELKFLTELICMRDASGQSSPPNQPNHPLPPPFFVAFFSDVVRTFLPANGRGNSGATTEASAIRH